MKKVAIVVQRCHESIVGGSESLAWQYATLLRDTYDVDVLTTTAIEISDWANVLPEGLETRDGVNIRRFPVTIGRTPYWGDLHDRLKADYPQRVPAKRPTSNGRYLKWTLSLQEEFIRTQGPYSAPLLDYLNSQWKQYASIIFLTYLYPTTYFGLLQIPRNAALMVPTLHDEPPAYLSAYKHVARRVRSLIWLTHAEQRLSRELWGELPGTVVSAGVDASLREPAKLTRPYVLYCGRIDPNKGARELFAYFMKYKSEFPSDLCLVLAGKDDLPIPVHPDIDFRGFVSPEEKYRLMAGAKVLMMPSQNESFSFVTMEAMAQQTPVLASAGSEVLVDHMVQSGAGLTYNDYQSFVATLNEMLGNENNSAEMGRRGREYVTSNFDFETIRASLLKVLAENQLPDDRPQSPRISMSSDNRLTIITSDQAYTVKLEKHSLKQMPGEGFYARPDTYDAQIFEDVAVHNEYDLPERFEDSDIIIDIGAHIGSFAYAVLTRGAGRVHVYEAHPVNYGITVLNLSKFGTRAICNNLAVWRSDRPDQTLYNDLLNGPYEPNTGGISLLWNDQGVEVQTVSLDQLLSEASEGFKNPIRLLKIDCEGAEYPILFTANHLHIVQEMCGEYHIIEPEQVPLRAAVGNYGDRFNGKGLRDFLEAQGYAVEIIPKGEHDGIFHACRPA